MQVLSAKVVAKAQSKARFGYVTLATREQAQKCISKLSGTELKGSTIHVELVSRRISRELLKSFLCASNSLVALTLSLFLPFSPSLSLSLPPRLRLPHLSPRCHLARKSLPSLTESLPLGLPGGKKAELKTDTTFETKVCVCVCVCVLPRHGDSKRGGEKGCLGAVLIHIASKGIFVLTPDLELCLRFHALILHVPVPHSSVPRQSGTGHHQEVARPGGRGGEGRGKGGRRSRQGRPSKVHGFHPLPWR